MPPRFKGHGTILFCLEGGAKRMRPEVALRSVVFGGLIAICLAGSPSAAPLTGYLHVTSEPERAEVHVEPGRTPPGVTPFKLELPIGTYKVRVVKDFYLPKEVSVNIRVDRVEKLHLKLERKAGWVEIKPQQEAITLGTGTLTIVTDLDGASISIDGQRAEGKTPLTIDKVPAGPHTLALEYRGVKIERNIVLNPGQTLKVEQSFTRELATKPVVDGVEMVRIPAGPFLMGSDLSDPNINNARPRHEVYLDEFFVDKTEVTNGQFKRFVDATAYRTTAQQKGASYGWTPDKGWYWGLFGGASWQSPYGPNTTSEPTFPAIHVAWSDAEAYCRWAGKRLPTEAEWEKAARGADERRFPWGDTPDRSRFHWVGSEAMRKFTETRVKSGVAPVGSYPSGASPYGVLDLAGNVAEWIQDWFAQDYYSRSPTRNPVGPDTGELRVVRGGSWSESSLYLRAYYRSARRPHETDDRIGFRCAR